MQHVPLFNLSSDSIEAPAMRRRNLMVVQGGGPTQVLNATLAALVDEAQTCGAFERIWGAPRGIKGLIGSGVVDLTRLQSVDLKSLRNSPGAVLGSSRAKPSEEDLEQLVKCLRTNEVHDMVFLGGNGSMRGAQVVKEHCCAAGVQVQVLGAPKTIDNDIAATDRCPGYASAARYVAQVTCDLGMDVRSLPQPVSILETMGRSVGWLAAAAAADKCDEIDPPHLVYVPERAFDMEKFLADLDRIVARQGWAIVVVAEGIRDRNGRFVYQVQDVTQADPLGRPITGGTAQFLAEQVAMCLKIRCRSEKPGLLGRSSMLHVSAQDRKDADLVGRAAVRGLLSGETDKMVSLRPLKDPGENGYEYVPLVCVTDVEKSISFEWTCEGEIPVRRQFFDYVRPLIGRLNSYFDPLPVERLSCDEGKLK